MEWPSTNVDFVDILMYNGRRVSTVDGTAEIRVDEWYIAVTRVG